MTTASTAFYLLIMLYVAGSVCIAYIAIRAYRHVRQRRDQSVALPRPVYETTQRKSPFSFVRTNPRNLNVWKLPVSWTRLPAGSSFHSKAASTASAKDLSIELLPTTALPPPPTSIPTSPPLVDLSTPSTLVPSSGSRFSSSLPSSPRRQALSLCPSSPHKGYRNIQHPAFPRPPSPHALLVTTPPHRQKRSRSLGGVPVRRLSSGQSGLRNKVDVDFVPGHSRGTSEEHLLIDFSSTSDDHILAPKDDTISPTASDIGVLQPSTDHKVVEPRPMPLVDIIGDVVSPRRSEPDDTAWMWFNSNAPSTIRSYDARVLSPRSQAAPDLGERKFAFPLPRPFPKTEKLIDIPSSGDACVELDFLDSPRTLVEVGGDLLGKEDQCSPIVTSVDVGAVSDPFSDDYAVSYIPSLSQTHFDEAQVQNDQDSSYPPLIDVEGSKSRVKTDQNHSSAYLPLVDLDNTHTDVETSAEERLVLGDSQILSGIDLVSPTLSPVPVSSSTGPPSLAEQTDWRWVEADDPWADHVTTVQDESHTLGPTYGGAAADSHLEPVTCDQGENGFMGTSPGGSLLATVLAADDEVPHLSLDDAGLAEGQRLSHVDLQGVDEDEEDATPRPTPISIEIQLPFSDSLPGIDIPGQTQPIQQAIVNGNFPDPDLLPLPEFNPLSSIVVRTSTNNDSENDLGKIEPRPSSQMPTPPASPPSLSPMLPNEWKTGKSLPPSPMTRPKSLNVASDMTRSRSGSSSPHVMPLVLPADATKEKPGDFMQDDSVPTLLTAENLPSGQAENDVEETIELNEIEDHKETMLPGSLPELSSTSSSTTSLASNSKTTQTVGALLTEKSGPAAVFYPSVRAIVRQPVEIALAMQLRPGLGAGADPAWMVRFLMAMFGWFAVLVSGQDNY